MLQLPGIWTHGLGIALLLRERVKAAKERVFMEKGIRERGSSMARDSLRDMNLRDMAKEVLKGRIKGKVRKGISGILLDVWEIGTFSEQLPRD